MRVYTNSRGYIALIAVLVIGAASLATALALLTSGTDTQRANLVVQQSIQARNLATACGEEALQLMQANTSYTGSSSITLGAGSCTYTVTSTGASTRIIDVSGTVKDVVRKSKIYATIGGSSISVTSWQEVSDS